jgi:L-fucose isomerase-like protein
VAQRIGVLALARTTFDIPFAKQTAAAMLDVIDRLGVEVVGTPRIVVDAAEASAEAASLDEAGIDRMLVLQLTFSDSTMIEAAADRYEGPLTLWAVPEERTGGRLRLNSFCGINLAAFALASRGRSYSYLLADPEPGTAPGLQAALRPGSEVVPGRHTVPDAATLDPGAVARAAEVRDRLAGTKVGVIGNRPDGFAPCDYDPDSLRSLTGVTVEAMELADLFEPARRVPAEVTAAARDRAAVLAGIDDVDQDELDRSLRFYPALSDIARDRGLSGLAVRCWPEAFTEYGGAVCGPAGMMNDDLVPTSCEADVYGNVTALALQWLTSGPVLVADLVDVDVADDTVVLWHCGKAPLSMADPEAVAAATVHSNRRKPLLNEFPLRPGRVTIARLSQARGETSLVVAGAEMLRAPLAFSGTAGVARFDTSAAEVADAIMAEGLEHHYGVGYGDVREELRALAAAWGIPVVEL